MALLLGAGLLRGATAEPVAVPDTCEREVAIALRLTGMKFCSFVEPAVVGIMLTVTFVQSMFIGYLLLAKRIEGYTEPEVDEEVPAEGQRLEELGAAAGVMESLRRESPRHHLEQAGRGSHGGEPRGDGRTSERDGGRQQRDRRAALDILVLPER